jgi:hypothetical protein
MLLWSFEQDGTSKHASCDAYGSAHCHEEDCVVGADEVAREKLGLHQVHAFCRPRQLRLNALKRTEKRVTRREVKKHGSSHKKGQSSSLRNKKTVRQEHAFYSADMFVTS